MKAKDLRVLAVEDLIQKEKDLKKELFDLHFQRKMDRVQKPGRFKTLRRDIAKILTVLKEKETDGRKSQ